MRISWGWKYSRNTISRISNMLKSWASEKVSTQSKRMNQRRGSFIVLTTWWAFRNNWSKTKYSLWKTSWMNQMKPSSMCKSRELTTSWILLRRMIAKGLRKPSCRLLIFPIASYMMRSRHKVSSSNLLMHVFHTNWGILWIQLKPRILRKSCCIKSYRKFSIEFKMDNYYKIVSMKCKMSFMS